MIFIYEILHFVFGEGKMKFCVFFFFNYRALIFATRKTYVGLGRVGNQFDLILQQPKNSKEW